MIAHWSWGAFLAGLIVGANVGLVLLALLFAARREQDERPVQDSAGQFIVRGRDQ